MTACMKRLKPLFCGQPYFVWFWIDSRYIPVTDYGIVYKRRYRNDSDWCGSVAGKWSVIYPFWILYRVLLLISCNGKGEGGLLSWRLPTGNLLCAGYLVSARSLGLNGVIYSQPIADVLAAIITVFMALNLHKKLSAEESRMALQSGTPEK